LHQSHRDVADLIGQRVPIEGEAGFGYLIASDYDMPPLMLTPDEIEAVMLGAQWVAGRSDKALSNAARDVMAKGLPPLFLNICARLSSSRVLA
jgi:predicted DNA-binding transcriptional regulator YafY